MAETNMASLQKAIALLEVVAADAQGLTAKQIAEQLGLPLATTYRLLKVLTEAEYVVHLLEQQRYALGYKLHNLGTALHRQVATPISVARLITELHIAADAAAYYAVHRGEDIVIAHVVDSRLRPRIANMGFGFRGAAHATAFGKVLLAGMSDHQLTSYLTCHGMGPRTPATIRSEAELRQQLTEIHREGLAVEREEFMAGCSCMAAPIINGAGQTIGSVAVSIDAGAFESRRPQLDRLLRQTAHQAGRALRPVRS